MKNLFFAIAATTLVATFTSCKKDNEDDSLTTRLKGTWSVTELKQEPTTGTTTTLSNLGTITFVNGGDGSYVLDYGNGADSGNFTWSAADNNATVAISAGAFNALTGQYTVISNTSAAQTWQRLNSDGDKFTYKLVR